MNSFFISSWAIRVGDSHLGTRSPTRGIQLKIQNYVAHPLYDGEKAYFDVGIILTDFVEFNKTIQPICLPTNASIELDKYARQFTELVGKIQAFIVSSTA
jgi:hypothetical protein